MSPKERLTSKSKASIYTLTTVTARTIAYACIQACFDLHPIFLSTDPRKTYIALSDMKQWGSKAKLFHLDEFYDMIVSLLEGNAASPWVKETLEWWNKWVYLPSTASLLIVSSQVSLKFRAKKKGAHSASKQTGSCPAQRISAQLASRTPIPASQAEDEHGEHSHADDRENNGDSETEPESADEDAHREWEERKQMREVCLQQKMDGVMNQDYENHGLDETDRQWENDGFEWQGGDQLPIAVMSPPAI
jgi:hypothetical protein